MDLLPSKEILCLCGFECPALLLATFLQTTPNMPQKFFKVSLCTFCLCKWSIYCLVQWWIPNIENIGRHIGWIFLLPNIVIGIGQKNPISVGHKFLLYLHLTALLWNLKLSLYHSLTVSHKNIAPTCNRTYSKCNQQRKYQCVRDVTEYKRLACGS